MECVYHNTFHRILSLIIMILTVSTVLINKGLLNTAIMINLGSFLVNNSKFILYKDLLSIKQKCENK